MYELYAPGAPGAGEKGLPRMAASEGHEGVNAPLARGGRWSRAVVDEATDVERLGVTQIAAVQVEPLLVHEPRHVHMHLRHVVGRANRLYYRRGHVGVLLDDGGVLGRRVAVALQLAQRAQVGAQESLDRGAVLQERLTRDDHPPRDTVDIDD